MARQATLFGKVAVKEPFFKISSECSSYYRTINALCRVAAAPGEWPSRVFSCRSRPMVGEIQGQRWRCCSSFGTRGTARSIVDWWATTYAIFSLGNGSLFERACSGWSAPVSSTTGTASTDNTDVEVVLSVSGARKPLAMLCEALDVNPSSFLTEDVVGKASVVATLTTVAERFALYRSEKRHYESSHLFHWQSSKLGQLMSKVDNQTDIVKSLMLEVSSIRIDPKLLLTTIGAQSVNTRRCLCWGTLQLQWLSLATTSRRQFNVYR